MIRGAKEAYRAKVPEFTGVVSDPDDYQELWSRTQEIQRETGLLPESRRREDLINFINQNREGVK